MWKLFCSLCDFERTVWPARFGPQVQGRVPNLWLRRFVSHDQSRATSVASLATLNTIQRFRGLVQKGHRSNWYVRESKAAGA
jgi:hypothetical protein